MTVWSRARLPHVAAARVRGRYFSSASKGLPAEADAVVVGGGSVGSSVFYHLLKDQGFKNVVLLERDAVTSGTTWHSAGMLWRLRPTDTDVLMSSYTRELCLKLAQDESKGGVEIESFFQNGGLFVANNQERLNEYQRLAEMGRYFGIESHVVDGAGAKEIHTLLNVDDVVGAVYSPTDGTMDPTSWVNALLKAGKRMGGQVFEQTQVVGVETALVGSPGRGNEPLRRVTGVRAVDPKSKEEVLIKTPVLVNACGAWARHLSLMAGADIPLRAMKHAFVVTEGLEGMKATFPNVRDHDLSIYLKAQGDSLALGGYEQNPEFCDHLVGGGRDDPVFSFGLFDLDFETFAQNLDGHIQRCPQVEQVGIKSTVCGPESFTPDHKALVGPQPGVFGLFQANGFNSMGLLLAGGVGQQVAQWIAKGSPEADMFSVDCARFRKESIADDMWVKDRTHESYAKTYAIFFPHDEALAGRGLRTSGVFEDLKQANCVFQARHAFERPGWFLEGGSDDVFPKTYDYYGAYPDEGSTWRLFGEGVPAENYPEGFMEQKRFEKHESHAYHRLVDGELTFDSWGESYDLVKKECEACRNGVVVFDQSYFGNYHVKGDDAQAFIQYLAGSDFSFPVDGEANRVVYTVFCNDAGGVEADLTIGKLSKDHFYISTGGNTRTKDEMWMQHVAYGGAGEGGRIYSNLAIEDTGDDVTILSVQGPQSRDLLAKAFEHDFAAETSAEFFSNTSIPFSHMREMSVRIEGVTEPVAVYVLRLTFVGERGYELHVPSKHASAIHRRIFATAAANKSEFPLVKNAGYRAIDSLSAEKGFRHWHADLSNADTPLEAGIGFTILPKLKAFPTDRVDFKGRAALEKKREQGLQRKLVCLVLSGEQRPLNGFETIWRDGKCVGLVKSTAFGFTIGKQIAYGYVDCPEGLDKITNKWLQAAERWEIGDRGVMLPAELSLKAPFDPQNLRVKDAA